MSSIPAEQVRVAKATRKVFNALTYALGGDGPKTAIARKILGDAARFERLWRQAPYIFRSETLAKWLRIARTDATAAFEANLTPEDFGADLPGKMRTWQRSLDRGVSQAVGPALEGAAGIALLGGLWWWLSKRR